MVSFSAYAEEQQVDDDDSTIQNLMVGCRRLDSTYVASYTMDGDDGGDARWGDWSEECPFGEAVSAVAVKYEHPDDVEDQTGVGDIVMYCREY